MYTVMNSLTQNIVILNYLETVTVPAGIRHQIKCCLVLSYLVFTVLKIEFSTAASELDN